MDVLGYYVNCDDAVCLDCALVGGRVSYDAFLTEWRARGGFEDWEEPLPIFWDVELDSPVHCSKCEDLIPVRLTEDGLNYVAEAIVREIQDGRTGGFEIVKSWWHQYRTVMERHHLLTVIEELPIYTLIEAVDTEFDLYVDS